MTLLLCSILAIVIAMPNGFREAKNDAPIQALPAVDGIKEKEKTGTQIWPDLIEAETSLRARLAKRRANRRRPIYHEDLYTIYI